MTEYICVDQEHDAWKCAKCGYIENFEADGPAENGWHFCPACGREITKMSGGCQSDEPEGEE